MLRQFLRALKVRAPARGDKIGFNSPVHHESPVVRSAIFEGVRIVRSRVTVQPVGPPLKRHGRL